MVLIIRHSSDICGTGAIGSTFYVLQAVTGVLLRSAHYWELKDMETAFGDTISGLDA